MAKTLKELFNKYTPTDEQLPVLEEGITVRSRVDKEKRILEVEADFSHIIPKSRLYEIEDDLCKAYQLLHCKILPKYPKELFDYDYISEILRETERVGIVAKGFFSDYTYTLDGNKLLIKIPFESHGISLLENAQTPVVIENIIKSEFDISISVSIEYDGRGQRQMSSDYRQKLDAIDRRIVSAEKAYGDFSTAASADTSKSESEEEKLPRLLSVYDDTSVEIEDDGGIRIGVSVFDVSEPQYVIGIPFEIQPVLISSVTRPVRNIIFVGEVFSFKSEENRTGDKCNITFGLFDGHSSIFVKRYSLEIEDAKELAGTVKNGMCIAVRGFTKGEKNDETELYMNYSDIALIKKRIRKDTAEKKRVELHLHTTMSAMDALIPPDVAVKTAKAWGHSAVAITDHGNVQGFPEAMIAAEKSGMKVIYGMEAYFVNSSSSALYGAYEGEFSDEFIVLILKQPDFLP